MGVVHSMEEAQIGRISSALRESAEAIQGINRKFDRVDEHWTKMQEHHNRINSKIDDTLLSFARMDDALQSKTETVLDVITYATDELSVALEGALIALSRFDLRRETTQLPKIIIPLTIPLIVLLIELAVANAYLGILLASLPEVRNKYSRYLLSNASTVLLGLTMSLVWLGVYRLWLSRKTRKLEKLAKKQEKDTQETLQKADLSNSARAPIRVSRLGNFTGGGASEVNLGKLQTIPQSSRQLSPEGLSRQLSTQHLEAELVRRGSRTDLGLGGQTMPDRQMSSGSSGNHSNSPDPTGDDVPSPTMSGELPSKATSIGGSSASEKLRQRRQQIGAERDRSFSNESPGGSTENGDNSPRSPKRGSAREAFTAPSQMLSKRIHEGREGDAPTRRLSAGAHGEPRRLSHNVGLQMVLEERAQARNKLGEAKQHAHKGEHLAAVLTPHQRHDRADRIRERIAARTSIVQEREQARQLVSDPSLFSHDLTTDMLPPLPNVASASSQSTKPAIAKRPVGPQGNLRPDIQGLQRQEEGGLFGPLSVQWTRQPKNPEAASAPDPPQDSAADSDGQSPQAAAAGGGPPGQQEKNCAEI